MNTTLHRETFIALRARREGYRIASEILNPPLNPDRPSCRDPDDTYLWTVRRQRWIRRDRLRALHDMRRLQMAIMVLGIVFTLGIATLILGYQMLYGTLQ